MAINDFADDISNMSGERIRARGHDYGGFGNCDPRYRSAKKLLKGFRGRFGIV